MRFCPICSSLLITNIKNNELKFQCYKCHSIYQSTPEDTLLSVVSLTSYIYDDNYLNTAFNDITNITIKKLCDNCGREYKKQIRLRDLTSINICYCGKRTINNDEAINPYTAE